MTLVPKIPWKAHELPMLVRSGTWYWLPDATRAKLVFGVRHDTTWWIVYPRPDDASPQIADFTLTHWAYHNGYAEMEVSGRRRSCRAIPVRIPVTEL